MRVQARVDTSQLMLSFWTTSTWVQYPYVSESMIVDDICCPDIPQN